MSSRYSIDQKVSLIISLQVFLLGAKNCLIQGIPFLLLINDTLNLFIMGLTGMLYLYAFWITRKRHLTSRCLLFWSFILLSYIFTILVFPQNVPYIKDTLLRVMTILFMTSILLSKMKDLSWLKRYMTIFSFPTIITGAISAFFISLIGHVTTAEYEGDAYAISLSYAVLIAVMWLLHDFFKYKKLIALVFALAGIIIILLYGARNPLLAIVTYLFMEVIDITEHTRSKAKRAFYRVNLCIIVLLGFFYRQVVELLKDISVSFGFNSRTLQKLTDDEVDMTGRDVIHGRLIDLINERPVTGLGIEGDHAQMGEMAHSLFLNMLSTYGYIIGSFFILFFLFSCASALKRSKGLDHQILVIYMCLVIPRGFTGGDMWQSDIFWWLMAIIFVIQSKNYNNVNKRIAFQN